MNLVFHLLNYIYNSIITYAYYACKSLVDCFPDYFISLFQQRNSLFGLVADGWCWFALREEYCWLVAAGCCWLVRSERKVLLTGS
jgi:hypothetical protein